MPKHNGSNDHSHSETKAHVEINFDTSPAVNGVVAEEGQSIELVPRVSDGKDFTVVPVTSDNEASPLRAMEARTNGHKNGTANESAGGGATDVDSPSDDGDDYTPSKKRCLCWDARCVLMVLLLLLIIVGGSVMAFMAHSEPGVEKVTEELILSSHFSDHMILQRAPARAMVWGAVNVRDNRTVVLLLTPAAGGPIKTYSLNVTKGVWSIQLDPISDSQPYNMSVYLEGKEHARIELIDILFGDVWICAGSMDITVVRDMEGLDNLNSYSSVRYLSIPSQQSNNLFSVMKRLSMSWSSAHEDILATSVDYYGPSKLHTLCWLYGRKLYDNLRYPIGVIVSTYPNAPIEEWVSQHVFETCRIDGTPYRRSSGDIWNAMISPLTYLTVKGFIWHEGEADVEYSPRRPMYNCTFVNMVQDWRAWFGNNSRCLDCQYPFGVVQITPSLPDINHMYTAFEMADRRWQQTANYGYLPNQHLPRTFLAPTIDLLEPLVNESRSFRWYNILATRLVHGAIAEAYSKNAVYRGPFPTNYVIQKSSSQLQLSLNVSALDIRAKNGFEVCCSGSPNHYCIASLYSAPYAENREWVAASLVSQSGATVTLSLRNCSQNMHVVGLRYAWHESPCAFELCPVYGKESQLPMSPYIRLGLIDNGDRQNLPQTKHDLL